MPVVDKIAPIDASSIGTFSIYEDIENLDKIKQIEKLILFSINSIYFKFWVRLSLQCSKFDSNRRYAKDSGISFNTKNFV